MFECIKTLASVLFVIVRTIRRFQYLESTFECKLQFFVCTIAWFVNHPAKLYHFNCRTVFSGGRFKRYVPKSPQSYQIVIGWHLTDTSTI